MKVCSSVTVFQDSIGLRMSLTYSEIDASGKVISDNKRIDRVLTDSTAKSHALALLDHAQAFAENLEE